MLTVLYEWERGSPTPWCSTQHLATQADADQPYDQKTEDDGHRLTLAGVGPVAYSEGMRMAAGIFAGRMSGGDEE